MPFDASGSPHKKKNEEKKHQKQEFKSTVGDLLMSINGEQLSRDFRLLAIRTGTFEIYLEPSKLLAEWSISTFGLSLQLASLIGRVACA
jgi:hypothetical protein